MTSVTLNSLVNDTAASTTMMRISAQAWRGATAAKTNGATPAPADFSPDGEKTDQQDRHEPDVPAR